MNELKVLNKDIDSITDFQKSLYNNSTSDNINLTSDNETDDVNTRFSCAVEKYGWSSHTKLKMVHTIENDEIVYTASKNYDVLFDAEIHIQLLNISVKDDYNNLVRICYPRNLGHNICNKGQLFIDSVYHQSIDSKLLDIKSQFYMKSGSGKRELYNNMIGNISELTEWQTSLPSKQLLVPQPYHYTRNTRVALRTLKSSVNTITHRYKFKTKLSEIIRMQFRSHTDEEFKDVPCNMKYLDSCDHVLPTPILKGKYALMTDTEREWYKNIKPCVIYIEDIFTASSKPVQPNDKVVIPLNCKSPTKGLFLLVQKVKDTENGNLSNYNNIKNGIEVDLKYGEDYKLEKYGLVDFISESWNSFPSAPCEPGYIGYSFGFEPNTLNSDTAIVFDKLNTSLHVKIRNDEIFDNEILSNKLHPNKLSLEKHVVYVRGLIYKKLILGWDEKSKSMKYLILDDATK